MKDKKVSTATARTPAIEISPPPETPVRNNGGHEVRIVEPDHGSADLSEFAQPAYASDSLDDPAPRARANSAGLKSLLKFRSRHKSSEKDKGASASPKQTTPQDSPPPEDKGGHRGLRGFFDSFRPRSKSDAASARNVMLQRRRNHSGNHNNGSPASTPAAAAAAQPTAAPPSEVIITAADVEQVMRPRATSWGARDRQLLRQDLMVSGGAAGAPTTMSQLLGGSPSRKMTVVDKNHHHLNLRLSTSPLGGDHFSSGKALVYRQSQSVDTEGCSASYRRVSSVGKRSAFKDSQWHSTDCSELENMEIEDLEEDDPVVFMKFMRAHKCYDLIPTSAKLVIFDTQLSVKKAFYALVYNGVRAALVWDASRQDYVGMLTITDFILILQRYYKTPEAKMEALEEHKIATWREELQGQQPSKLVTIAPDASVFDAVRMLLDRHVHRLAVVDSASGNALYIMTHKRILKFIYLFMRSLPTPVYLNQTLEELKVGTYENLASVAVHTPLIEVLNVFVARRVSALPVLNNHGKVVDIYSKFDVINLAADKTYCNLDVSVSQALSYRKSGQEGVLKCSVFDTLAVVIEKIVKAGVHRLIVCNNRDEFVGIVSLSDILARLVSGGEAVGDSGMEAVLAKTPASLAAGCSQADTALLSAASGGRWPLSLAPGVRPGGRVRSTSFNW